jgi:hypothetical protein
MMPAKCLRFRTQPITMLVSVRNCSWILRRASIKGATRAPGPIVRDQLLHARLEGSQAFGANIQSEGPRRCPDVVLVAPL